MVAPADLAPLGDVKPPVPGGEYVASQNKDGTWNVFDVPIFCEHVITGAGKKLHLSKLWMDAAISKAHSRLTEDRYLSPLHINHHDFGKETVRAGWYLLQDVRVFFLDGEAVWTSFADFIAVPPGVYDLIRKSQLPYRSVEIHDIREQEIDSLALMADEVPFFRLEMLTIGKELPPGRRLPEALELGMPVSVAASAKNRIAPLLAYSSLGTNGARMLFRFNQATPANGPDTATGGGNAMGKKLKDKQVSDEALVALYGTDLEDLEEVEIEIEEEEQLQDEEDEHEARGGTMSKLKDMLGQMLNLIDAETIEEAAGEDLQDEEEEDDGPSPVEMAKRAKKAKRLAKKRADDGEEDLAIKLQRTEGKVDGLLLKTATVEAVQAELTKLAPYSLNTPGIAKKLMYKARKYGLPAMQAYAESAREHGVREPGDELDDAMVPGSAKQLSGLTHAYSSLGPKAVEQVEALRSEYKKFTEKGMRPSFDEARYVHDNMARIYGGDAVKAVKLTLEQAGK